MSKDMQNKNEIGVKITVPGFHFWKDAPDEVAFLRHNHRHLFGIEIVFKVDHNDRNLEFFLMQRSLREYLESNFGKSEDGYLFGGMSCESIAQSLVDDLGLLWAKVDEDGENWGKAYPKS